MGHSSISSRVDNLRESATQLAPTTRLRIIHFAWVGGIVAFLLGAYLFGQGNTAIVGGLIVFPLGLLVGAAIGFLYLRRPRE